MRNLHFFSCLWGCCTSSSTPYASEDEVTNLRRDLKIVEGTLKSALNDLAVARNQAEAAEQNLKELVSLTTEHLLDPDKVWTDGEIVLQTSSYSFQIDKRLTRFCGTPHYSKALKSIDRIRLRALILIFAPP